MNRSLQLRLAIWLSAAIVLTAVVAGVFSFRAAIEDAHELQDDVLRQAALVLARQPERAAQIQPAQTPRDGKRKHHDDREKDDDHDDDDDHERRVQVQPLPAPGETITTGGLDLPPTLTDGLHTVHVHGADYRVMVKTLQHGQRIALSQPIAIRDQIAQGSAWRTVLPLLVLMPLLLGVAVVLVRNMLSPVRQLATNIDARSEHDLQPLPAAGVPSEIHPFVTAINRLLGRVDEAMQSQRRFVADAAHELRSPLTALSLQAERLGTAPMSDEAHDRLQGLQQGLERSRKLLEQLLSLARAQQGDSAQAPQAISVRHIYRRVLEDLMPLAQAKHLDIGIAEGEDVQITAHDVDVFTLLRNLVDNAIRYTPDGGRVDLSVRKESASTVLEVEDSGIGIPSEERARVLDPFYRVLGTEQTGSGLGLSIAQAIVQKLGGKLELLDATQFAQGLKVRVVLP